MTSVNNLCKKSILLKNGGVERFDNSDKTIQHYLQGTKPLNTIWERESLPSTEAFFLRAYITDHNNNPISLLDNGSSNYLNLEVQINENESVGTIAFLINSLNGTAIFCSHDYDCEKPIYFNKKNLFSIPLPNFLMPGTYTINLGINGQGFYGIDDLKEVLIFDVIGNSPNVNPLNDQRGGLIYYPLKWSNKTQIP